MLHFLRIRTEETSENTGGHKNHPLSTKSTKLNIFNVDDSVDRDKPSRYVTSQLGRVSLLAFVGR